MEAIINFRRARGRNRVARIQRSKKQKKIDTVDDDADPDQQDCNGEAERGAQDVGG